MAKYNPTYTIDLISVLDKSYSSEEFKNKARQTVSTNEFKRIYGQRVVDRIVERTRELNIDKNSRSLGVYSKAYKKSLIFQIYKSGETSVNLTLTSAMLDSLVHKSKSFDIVISLEESQRDKARGHITGKLGKAKAKKRDFLGLPMKEEVEIFKQTLKDIRGNSLELQSELELS